MLSGRKCYGRSVHKSVRAIWALLIACALAIALTAAIAQPFTSADAASPRKVSASVLLKSLHVRAETPRGYVRAKFKLWVTHNSNCNTRERVLIDESTSTVTKTRNCTVKSGTWLSRYDGVTVKQASKLDIDHVVPLAEAWRSGANHWSSAKREAYANDLGYAGSLMAVSAHANRSKGDEDPDRWMPAKWKCQYVADWIAIKYRWKLSIDHREQTFLRHEMHSCASSTTMVVKPAQPVVSQLIGSSSRKANTQPITKTTPKSTSGSKTTNANGATARCKDGTYSYAAHHQGACSQHNGVAVFFK